MAFLDRGAYFYSEEWERFEAAKIFDATIECRQVDSDASHADEDYAIQVCDGCPVEVECLEFALRFDQNWNVWGGKTRDERREIKRERAAVRGVLDRVFPES